MYRSKSMLLVAFILVAVLLISGAGGGVWAKPGGGGAAIPAVSSQVVPPLVSSPCKGSITPITTVFTAGVKDNFATGNPEPNSPSPLLQAYIAANYPNTQGFDGNVVNRSFGHTFINLPPNIAGAKLEIGLKSLDDPMASNDAFYLYKNLTNTPPFAWGSAMSALSQPILILDLAALPGSPSNILSNINASNSLDIYMQDDTVVDYITLTVETCPGTIVIRKVAVPLGTLDFEFGGSWGQFFLDDDGINNNPLSNTKTFANLTPGTYTVKEAVPPGWVLSISCNDPTGGTTVASYYADIDLASGETVTCIFTNKGTDVPPTPSTTYIYSVKIVCGTVTPPRPKPSIPTLRDPAPVVPGLYRTAVNIHNFWEKETTFLQKVAIALPQDQPRGPVTKKVQTSLRSNEAVEVDCYNVVAILEGTSAAKAEFLKGFVVIESPVELEVTAVYTAEELQENGISIDVEQIQPHVIRPSVAGPTGTGDKGAGGAPLPTATREAPTAPTPGGAGPVQAPHTP